MNIYALISIWKSHQFHHYYNGKKGKYRRKYIRRIARDLIRHVVHVTQQILVYNFDRFLERKWLHTWGPFYWPELTLIPAWMGNHMPRKWGKKLFIHSQTSTVIPLKHSRLIPMYNARFILWPSSLSSPIRMGRERRWPRWIKKALHIGNKRLCIEVWEYVGNFILHFRMYVITYPCWN